MHRSMHAHVQFFGASHAHIRHDQMPFNIRLSYSVSALCPLYSTTLRMPKCPLAMTLLLCLCCPSAPLQGPHCTQTAPTMAITRKAGKAP